MSARGGLEQILDINNLIPLLRNLRILDPIRLVCFITIRICLSSSTFIQFRCEGCMIFKVRWFLLSRLTELGEDVGNGGRNSFSELLGHLDTMWSREYCWAW